MAHSVFMAGVALCLIAFLPFMATADPQTNLTARFCGQTLAIDPPSYYATLNATSLPDIRSALSSSLNASSHAGSSHQPLHAFFQCREYLNLADCLACFDAAASLIGRCYPSSHGFVVYDGCSLGFQSSSRSYDWESSNSVWPIQTTCEDRMVAANEEEAFSSVVAAAVEGLVREVPKGRRLFGADKVVGYGGNGSAVYAVGQCLIAQSVDSVYCRNCLQSAHQNIMGCPPATGGRSMLLECFLRYSDRPFFNESQVVLLDTHDEKKDISKLLVGVCVGAAVAFCMIILVVRTFVRRSQSAAQSTAIEISRFTTLGITQLREPVSFRYRDIQHATENFSDKNKLGQGGFGVVYKGVLKKGRVVAVKKLTVGEATETRAGFESEIILLSNTRHRNLVSLLGYCKKGTNLLLVYEYMEKGSLEKALFGTSNGEKYLSWRQRFDIIVGIARGLIYLHEDFCVPIIHRDIKCENILLDNNFQAKIGDFGLARLFPENQSHIRSRLAGTIGYSAPEYTLRGHLSEKVDIYSFGILILEIISRRRCNYNDLSSEDYLLEQAWRLYETDSLLDLADETMEVDESEKEGMKRVIQVGLMCTQSCHLRPAISEAMTRILSNDDVVFHLHRPTFINKLHVRTIGENLSPSASGNKVNMSGFYAC